MLNIRGPAAKEPAKAFRFSPQMKEVYYECIKLDEELTAVIIDTQCVLPAVGAWTKTESVDSTEKSRKRKQRTRHSRPESSSTRGCVRLIRVFRGYH